MLRCQIGPTLHQWAHEATSQRKLWRTRLPWTKQNIKRYLEADMTSRRSNSILQNRWLGSIPGSTSSWGIRWRFCIMFRAISPLILILKGGTGRLSSYRCSSNFPGANAGSRRLLTPRGTFRMVLLSVKAQRRQEANPLQPSLQPWPQWERREPTRTKGEMRKAKRSWSDLAEEFMVEEAYNKNSENWRTLKMNFLRHHIPCNKNSAWNKYISANRKWIILSGGRRGAGGILSTCSNVLTPRIRNSAGSIALVGQKLAVIRLATWATSAEEAYQSRNKNKTRNPFLRTAATAR